MPKVTEEHKENMRRKIRRSAKKLFLEKGFRGVTMKDIVTASELSFGAVYSYYSNTSDIFLKLKEEEMSADQEDYQRIFNAISKSAIIEDYLVFLTKRLANIHETLIPATYDYLTYVKKGTHHNEISEIVYKQIDEQLQGFFQQTELVKEEEIINITAFLAVYVEGLYFQQAFIEKPATEKSLESLRYLLNKLFL